MAERTEKPTGKPDSAPRPSWWRFALSKTGIAIGALVVAIAGVAGPFTWNAVRDLFRPPLLVTAVVENTAAQDYSYAFGEVIPPERVAELGDLGDYPAAGPRVPGATKLNELGTRITVEGASSRNVVITDMRVRVLDRGPNVAGTAACVGPQGDVSTIRVGFDLDEPNPIARTVEGREWGGSYFLDNAIALADGEAVVFQVAARAEKAHYTWVLELAVVIDGEPGTIEVRPEDGPYQLTGAAESYGSVFHWYRDLEFSPVPAGEVGKCVERSGANG
ncbi:hypothetical protein LZ318_39860 [Saccharopolyspora indica]|uniref:hypothetical protein n=1 Tax=Saccharopolyspora indica TaxID=1229659 RepID=UPI0022EA9716|nr:hypothetical protein [Saccharopolyspora indica]MDA3649363.1 hypothetical protein [Saccharopolyspora indica]